MVHTTITCEAAAIEITVERTNYLNRPWLVTARDTLHREIVCRRQDHRTLSEAFATAEQWRMVYTPRSFGGALHCHLDREERRRENIEQ